MSVRSKKIEDSCGLRERITAYIDGELSSREELDFDFHLTKCKTCSDELNAHKMVSTSLEILLDEKTENFELPENFTKVVTTKAESDVSGLRHPKERSLAFFITSVLILLVVIGLGTEIDTVWLAADKFAHQFMAVGGFIWHTIHNISLGFAVITRFVSYHYVYSSATGLFFILAFFAITAIMLSRMVLRFNRS